MNLGISGTITKAFIRSPLTPLLLLAALAVGSLALFALAREEEPQISVPMVDILINADGLRAEDAIGLVTKPLESIVKGIDAVEHVYSQTRDDRVAVTVRFLVGTDQDTAILRVHEKIRAHMDALPRGIPEPLIVGRGINDVPIVVLTMSAKPGREEFWDDNGLFQVADQLLPELMKVRNVGLSFIVGGHPSRIRIEPNPEKLTLYGVTLQQLMNKVEQANRSFLVGTMRETNASVEVAAGQTLQGVADIGMLLLTTRDGRAVYVRDVADVVVGGDPKDSRVRQLTFDKNGFAKGQPAISIAIAKRKGANAVEVSHAIIRQLDLVHGRLVPEDLQVEVTRDYGETALEKANELLFHLGLATVSIVILITLVVGWREGMVVMVVIPITILLTLFAAYLMGYTINRVSLFALIFSIGILVDDAIVVVENIVRHWSMKDGRSVLTKAIEGVAEVGNPTIIATLTIVAALLPMMFVSGLMGPYMSPIPANASTAMIFSFFVAMTLTPWLLMVLAGGRAAAMAESGHGHDQEGVMERFYRRVAGFVLTGRVTSKVLLLVTAVATVAVCVLFYTRHVTVKLLPFDNKSEMQVVVDLPYGSPVEMTERVLMAAATRMHGLPELTSIQLYAGTAAPFNFSGLVRHTYLRGSPEMGDLQINLTPKHARDRTSHQVALDVRARLKGLEVPPGTTVKIVEVPPGPPVMSTLLAEIYGPDATTRRAIAGKVRDAFERVDYIVDVDDTFHTPHERLRFAINQESLEFYGVQESHVYDSLRTLLGGARLGYSHRGHGANPIEISVQLGKQDLFPSQRILSTPIPATGPAGDDGRVVELGDVVSMRHEPASFTIFRRDGHFADMVTAEMSGRYEAPIYGMLAVEKEMAAMDWSASGGMPAVRYNGQPEDESKPSVLWDGEWEITYITFRDMGAAFAVAVLAIYLLVVGQFGSFKLPLVILVPVPLTLIGIVLGHWAFGAPFTATSMIGFIALAGIIVRNSILLVDFINHRRTQGGTLRDALVDAGATRFKPIFLTAVAAVIGAAFILADPIFQGLAISMVFGLASSTALTLLVIPAIYVWLRDDGKGFSVDARQ
ncbi:MAG: efflux RND transporter permease subunit [Alphaproteobacteria bacterium]